jgi:hypothetical protein
VGSALLLASRALDLTSFAIPCTYPAAGGTGFANSCIPGTRHFGNEGRNSLIGPHFRQFDFSIFKDTAITERIKLELRFEAYDLFYHPNFANPYLPAFIADAAANGVGSNGRSLGALRLTATGDVGIGYPVLEAAALAACRLPRKSAFSPSRPVPGAAAAFPSSDLLSNGLANRQAVLFSDRLLAV